MTESPKKPEPRSGFFGFSWLIPESTADYRSPWIRSMVDSSLLRSKKTAPVESAAEFRKCRGAGSVGLDRGLHHARERLEAGAVDRGDDLLLGDLVGIEGNLGVVTRVADFIGLYTLQFGDRFGNL